MNDADDQLLGAVLAGDLGVDAPAWKAALARDPSLAKRLDELRSVMRALDRTGEDERATLAAARVAASDADLELVRAAARSSRRATARPWWRSWTALAAALVLAALGMLVFEMRGQKSSDGPHDFLGPGHAKLLEPNAEFGDARSFRWEGELPIGGTFIVRIFDVDSSGRAGTMAIESGRCEVRQWQPSSAELAKIPQRFFWEVETLPAGGSSGTLSEQSPAQRSRP